MLAGLSWTVQGVVYPAFRLVPKECWRSYHARHCSAITWVLMLPWGVQAVTGVSMLARPGTGRRLPVIDAILNLVPLTATATLGTRLHRRLARNRTEKDIQALLALNLLRAQAWTVATGTGLALFAHAAAGSGTRRDRETP